MSVGAPELLVGADGAMGRDGELDGAETSGRSPRQLFWRRFRSDRVALYALAVIVLLIAAAVFAPLIVKLVGAPGPYKPDDHAVNQFGLPAGPSGAHIFGVDLNHLDVFSRVLYGARTSLEVAIVATGISLVIGVTLGMVAGYFRGAVDTAISRVIDVLLAFPILLLAIGVGAACTIGVGGHPSKGCLGGALKPGLPVVIAVIAFVNWTYIARIIRGQVLSLREKEFIESARSLGTSNRRIIFSEILPNLVAPILVYATLIIPTNVLFEAALSYLGVGVRYPTASWGKMLSDASGGNLGIGTVWWLMLFPGLALLLTVLAFNLLGDGLQDALNPRASRA
jgi:peptide/nickel transport system permease protein